MCERCEGQDTTDELWSVGETQERFRIPGAMSLCMNMPEVPSAECSMSGVGSQHRECLYIYTTFHLITSFSTGLMKNNESLC